jgi:ABC-type bacteriocin/lantibiotic exporter with double-glycine peptidase domain
MINILQGLFKVFNNKEKIKFIFTLILIFLSLILETIGISLVLPLINILITKNQIIGISFFDKFILNYNLKESFFIYLAIFCIFFVIKNFILAICLYFQIKIVYNIKQNYSIRLFKDLLSKKYNYYIVKNSSFFLHKLGQSLNDFTNSLIFVFNTITDLTFLFLLTCLLFFISPKLTIIIIFFIFLPLQMFIFLKKKKQSAQGNKKTKLEEMNIKNIQQSINGIKEIKLLNLENYFFNIFKINISKICEYETKQRYFASLPKLLIELSAISLFAGIILVFSLSNFERLIELMPSAAIFVAAAFRAMPSISRLSNNQQMINFYKPVIKSINNEFNLKSKNLTFKNFKKPSNKNLRVPKTILLKNLYFEHRDGKKVFNNFTKKIELKKLVGIFGETGSGKSTLVDLIIGFLEPSGGQILFDKKNILKNKSLLNKWQNILGYVPQVINIIDETIEKNIALGVEEKNINKKKIYELIKICNLEKLIDSKKNKINSFIGDKGINISGGQKQQIGICRALYFNPKILILDESTNALDEKNERKLLKNLINYKDLTCIILITHKKKLIRYCNEIVEIK